MKDFTADDAREVRDHAIEQVERNSTIRLDLKLSDAIRALQQSDSVEGAKTFLVCLKLPNAILEGELVP